MNIFLDESELTEIKPLEENKDKGLVINPEVGKRSEGASDLVKEITALDTLTIGPTLASQINGVPISSASKYSSGKDIGNNETRARVLGAKYDIEDLATTKLMDTLNLLDPRDCEKPKDKIALLNSLSSLVDKIGPKKEDNNSSQVHLHLYGPSQKRENQYETIDV